MNEAQDAELEATHALELLAATVGEPPKSSLKAILAGTTDADLVSVGKTILSSRIVTDAARIYRKAWDFYRQATDEQKRRLRGFSKPLLALAVQQALALEKLDRQRATTNASAGIARAGQDKASEAAQSRAIELRDQAYDPSATRRVGTRSCGRRSTPRSEPPPRRRRWRGVSSRPRSCCAGG